MKRFFCILLLGSFSWITYGQDFYSGKKAATMADVFHSHCCLLGKYRITGSVDMFFNKITYLDKDGTTYTDFNRYGANFNLIFKFYKEWQVRLIFLADMHSGPDKPKWLSNLYYAAGNYEWRNKHFFYGYENYQPNRFDGSYNLLENMKRGFFFVGYNYDLLAKKSPLKLDATSQIRLIPFVRYQPEYTDRFGKQVMGHHKITLGTSARYTIWHHIYVEGAVFFYPVTGSVLPWDPDYTYGFGYFDWHHFTLDFSYGNWIANRFPWHVKEMKNDFSNGEFKLGLRFIW